jgi:transcription initiation factor IIE alpha subunit
MFKINMVKANDKYLYSETASVQDVYSRKIGQLSPSVKLVFKVLEYKGLLTQKELVAESYLPPRTVRYALSRLKKEGILEERLYYKDARQCLYGVKSPQQDELLSNFACGMV